MSFVQITCRVAVVVVIVVVVVVVVVPVQDIDECAANNGMGTCGKYAFNCTNKVAGFDCACHPGFAFDGNKCSGQLNLLVVVRAVIALIFYALINALLTHPFPSRGRVGGKVTPGLATFRGGACRI